jgi:hypothetical protein
VILREFEADRDDNDGDSGHRDAKEGEPFH